MIVFEEIYDWIANAMGILKGIFEEIKKISNNQIAP